MGHFDTEQFLHRTTTVYIHVSVDGPSPEVVVVPGIMVGVDVGAGDGPTGGIQANGSAASGNAPLNIQ